MSGKQRPFTRRQRARIQKAKRIEARTDARATREEERAYQDSLVAFRRVDPQRTEDLADGKLS